MLLVGRPQKRRKSNDPERYVGEKKKPGLFTHFINGEFRRITGVLVFHLRFQLECFLPGATPGYPKMDSVQKVPTPAITYGNVILVLNLN